MSMLRAVARAQQARVQKNWESAEAILEELGAPRGWLALVVQHIAEQIRSPPH